MVLEQLFKPTWLERRPLDAFFMGALYAIIGIMSAGLIFRSSPSLMSVAFTSILLLPSLSVLLRDEENVEIREKKLSLRLLFRDHRDIFGIYLSMFLGIFLVYGLIAGLMSAETIQHLFSKQLAVGGFIGQAFLPAEFASILWNNILVLVVAMVLSLVYGAGAILFLTWNASVWGAIFGFVARQTATAEMGNPFTAFFLIIIPVLPHLITEAMAYLSGAIAGGVLSKAVIREKLGSKKFMHILTDALILLGVGVVLVIIGAVIEAKVFF